MKTKEQALRFKLFRRLKYEAEKTGMLPSEVLAAVDFVRVDVLHRIFETSDEQGKEAVLKYIKESAQTLTEGFEKQNKEQDNAGPISD